ncbi:unnamed protein product, partial [marine sediment metagenome]
VLSQTAAPPRGGSGWLFHLDCRNVVATRWEPLVEGDRPVGFRVRLLETEGCSARLRIRSFRAVRSAQKINPAGESPDALSIQDDCITIDISPHQWVQVEGRFAHS